MDKESYSAADAARILGVSIPTLKTMVADGDLKSFKTSGGHLRISASSIEAFQNGDNGHTSRSAAQPSSVLTNRRERVQELALEAQELRARRDLGKLRQEADEEAARERQEELQRERELRGLEERNRLEQERLDHEQEKAERTWEESEQRREWEERWQEYAICHMPRDCPVEYRVEVNQAVSKALENLSPSHADDFVNRLVEAATEKGLKSWRRHKAAEDAIKAGEGSLPFAARNFSFSEPTAWQAKVRRLAKEEIAKLGEDPSPEEIRAAAIEAARTVAREYEAAEETASQKRQESSQRQANEMVRAIERGCLDAKIRRGLAHVNDHIRLLETEGEIEFDSLDVWGKERDRLVKKLEKRIYAQLAQEIKSDPDLDDEDIQDIVEDLVAEVLSEYLDED